MQLKRHQKGAVGLLRVSFLVHCTNCETAGLAGAPGLVQIRQGYLTGPIYSLPAGASTAVLRRKLELVAAQGFLFSSTTHNRFVISGFALSLFMVFGIALNKAYQTFVCTHPRF
ncbi:hypothetical protein V8F20_003138 [Naviculisporaceae sp. PSN 640]